MVDRRDADRRRLFEAVEIRNEMPVPRSEEPARPVTSNSGPSAPCRAGGSLFRHNHLRSIIPW